MKKISTLLFFMSLLAIYVHAQINFNQVNVEDWIGTGPNEVMFVVDFDSDSVGVESAFAWGIHFENDSISGVQIIELIAQSNPDFIYSGAGFLDNISYTSSGQTYTNPNTGWFSILESFDGETWAWNSGISDNVGNGQWFGIVVMNPDTWEAEINVPLLETGIENLYTCDIKVYPNPATERLYFGLDQEASIQLMNLAGQMVYSSTGRIESIDVSGIPKGLYVLAIVSDNQISSKKVMVK
ncbi:MAG: T9SS type A sorting domain-containing protein [Bacteroidales bacterium]